MSPREAKRLVGHPDIVERLRSVRGDGQLLVWMRESAAEIERLRSCEEALMEGGEIIIELKQDVERLRGTLRAVRCSTDPVWQKKLINEALGETTP